MISLNEINNAAKQFSVPAETIEKDYVICWILASLSIGEIFNHFVFYGGTAIKRMYFTDHRFSEDIDLLSDKHFSANYIVDALKTLSYAKQEANISLSTNPDSFIITDDRLQCQIEYNCFDEITGAPKEIRLDFAMKRQLPIELEKKAIIPTYSDLDNQKQVLTVMSINSILANKLGMILEINRQEPRDIFDIWFILTKRNEFNFNFINVCQLFKNKYGYNLTPDMLGTSIHKKSFKRNWEIRLSKQLAEIPCYKQVISNIESDLDSLFDQLP